MSINVNLNDMENLKESLLEFGELVRDNPDKSLEAIVKGFMDYHQLNSRPREPRAVNRNEQAKELRNCKTCVHKNIEGFMCRTCYNFDKYRAQ